MICIDGRDLHGSLDEWFSRHYGRQKNQLTQKVICIIDTRSCSTHLTAAYFFPSSSEALDVVLCLCMLRRMRESYSKRPGQIPGLECTIFLEAKVRWLTYAL
ncbi:hypothetical protein H0G86_007879 [Trichoderma simmonsii]|uniref:Uncharacterized protein n=1 Tax=Trichoderma simmonsii TaxID=1491479 RepID=A0A8G0LHE5_9HYPO|nr:hypothetical protein H0G86_007879 [Trichoderma simmonsii]